jgi:hypothetical protein
MVDILGAVHSFLTSKMGIDGNTIIRGWQNRASLPNATDYVVLTLLTNQRHGTNVHQRYDDDYSQTDLIEKISMLGEHTVQVDFCGMDEQEVMARATQLCIFARDAVAVDFLKPYGILPLYGENVRSMPFTNEQRQWEVRYGVTWHIECWHDAKISRDAFTNVNIKIEDVDVHHPITTE